MRKLRPREVTFKKEMYAGFLCAKHISCQVENTVMNNVGHCQLFIVQQRRQVITGVVNVINVAKDDYIWYVKRPEHSPGAERWRGKVAENKPGKKGHDLNHRPYKPC